MRFRFFCWLAILPFVSVGGADAAPPAREPVAVAYLSSIDGTLDDIDYVVTSGGQPHLSQMIKGFITNLNNLEGIDRTQPIGVFAFMPLDLSGGKQDPDIVGFIPVTDVEQLKQTAHLSNVLSLESTDKPNRYEFKTPEKTFSVLIDQGHAFITERSELLEHPLPTPAPLTEALGGQYDVVVHLRREGVPRLVWDFVSLAAISASDKEIKKLKEKREPEDLLKVRGLEMGRRTVVAVMTEARSAWVGLRVSREARNAVMDVQLEFADSGKVAKALTEMCQSPAALNKAAQADVPAGGSFHLAVPEEARKLSAEMGRFVREKKNPIESIPEPQRTSVNALVDVLQETIDGGVYELLVQFTGEPQTGMTLVAGLHVSDGKKLSEAVAKLLPEAANSDEVSMVTLDVGEARGVHFSRVDGQEKDADDTEKEEQKVELFYGGKPSLYIGTEATTLWLLVGDGDALEDFTSLAEESQVNADRTAPAAFVQAHLHLSDWLGLLSLAKDKKTQEFTEAARIAVKDPDRDALRFAVRPVSAGLQLTLTLDEAYLNLLGATVGKN